MSDDKKAKKTNTPDSYGRLDQLLRDNLHKRKAQKRARTQGIMTFKKDNKDNQDG